MTTRQEKIIQISFFITVTMFFIQLIGGFITNSLAILSDAWHLSTDILALFLSWFAIRQTRKPANETHTYGYHRFGSLAALINGLTLIAVSLFIAYQSITRLIHPAHVHSTGMIGLAIIGFLATLLITLILKNDTENINVKSAFLHFLGDVLSYFSIIIGGILIYFTDVYWIDPILSGIFALVILRNAWEVTREASLILLEAVPGKLSIPRIKERLLIESEIVKVLDLHVWGLSNEHISLSTHLAIRNMEFQQTGTLIHRIEEILYEEFGIAHTTIQFHVESQEINSTIRSVPNIH
ncbi:MAG TPA: cation transporter [Paenibacillaceae bacterium]|nr:cation transporter [Paenibacillaceae bacterium]